MCEEKPGISAKDAMETTDINNVSSLCLITACCKA